MAKGQGFAVQLEDIPNPQGFARSGQLIEQAGQTEGAAALANAKANVFAATTLFDVADKAVSGYAEAQVSKDTKAAVAKFEDAPENTKGRIIAGALESYDARIAAEPEGIATSPTGREDPSIVALRNEAVKYRKAEAQGLLTKDEVLTRVAASVKKWSSIIPGLQSEFRKVAANETGISNIDVFQIHQALTTQSDREKAAERAARAEEKYIGDVAAYHGVPPSAVDRNMAQRFFMSKQLDAQRQAVENEVKVGNLTAEQKGRGFDQLIGSKHSSNLLVLSDAFNDWEKANQDPTQTKRRDLLAAQINGALGTMRIDMSRYITDQSNVLGLNSDEREKRLKAQDAEYDKLDKVLKSKDGFDTFRQIIGRNKDSAEDMMARFKLSFPMLQAWGAIGVAPELFKVALAPGGEQTLIKALGKEGAKQIMDVVKGDSLTDWARVSKRMYGFDVVTKNGPMDVRGPEAAAYSPEEKQIATRTAEGDFTLVPAIKDPTPEDKEKWDKALHFLTANSVVEDPKSLNRWVDKMDDANVQRALAEVPVARRAEIAAPIFNKYALPVREGMNAIYGLVASYNADEGNRGSQIEVVQNDAGQLIVLKSATPTGGRVIGETPAGGVTGLTEGRGVSESASAKDSQAFLEQRLVRMNANLKALGAANYIATLDDNKSAAVIGAQIIEGLDTGEFNVLLSPGEERAAKRKEAAVAPVVSPQDYNKSRDEFLLKEEGSHPVAYKDSSKAKNPTIGIGFNLNRGDAADVLSKVLGKSKEDVTLLREGARVLTKPEVEKLYQWSVAEAEGVVTKRLEGVELAPAQRQALVSLAFNAKVLIGDKLVAALKSGNLQAAVDEVLYKSGTDSNPKLAGRRYREAQLLINGDESIHLPAKASYLKGTKPIKRAEGEPERVAGIFGEPIQHPTPNPNDILGTRG